MWIKNQHVIVDDRRLLYAEPKENSVNLSKLLAAKLKSEKLSVAGAAKKIGVSIVSVTGTLRGKSKPNARSLGKYAKFLGLSTDDAAKAAGRDPAAESTGKGRGRRGRGALRAAGGRRGRPRGGIAGALDLITSTVTESEAILADELAVAVHRLPKAKRAIIEPLIRGL